MSQFTSKLSIYISCPKINFYSISNGEEILKFNFQYHQNKYFVVSLQKKSFILILHLIKVLKLHSTIAI